MNEPLTIEALRLELGLTQDQFARKIGLSNKGSVSVIERGGPCSLNVALSIERLSGGRIDAASLNADVASARSSNVVPVNPDQDHSRVVICSECDHRLDGVKSCPALAVDCPHAFSHEGKVADPAGVADGKVASKLRNAA